MRWRSRWDGIIVRVCANGGAASLEIEFQVPRTGGGGSELPLTRCLDGGVGEVLAWAGGDEVRVSDIAGGVHV